jgi:hypothetical protein
MPRCYLNAYQPLAAHGIGREAAQQHRLPPLSDGSIRREPDLAHDYPGVSGLCRSDLAPRLECGDRVGYLTMKSNLGKRMQEHHRLTAVLEVVESLPSHQVAATWYRGRALLLPSNCMVPGNLPQPLAASHGQCSLSPRLSGSELWDAWNHHYHERALQYPTFVVCRTLYRDLSWTAPLVTDDHLALCFGESPSTQNPTSLDCSGFEKLLKVTGIRLPPASRPAT